MSEEELMFTLALTKVHGIGPIIGKRLIENFGSAKSVFKASKKELIAKRVNDTLLAGLKDKKALVWAEQEVELIRKHQVKALFYQAKEYPFYLRQCDDAPVLLFAKGMMSADWSSRHVISLIGTRNPTKRGLAFCTRLLEEVLPFNPIIVSGLAYGIDVCSHKIALQLGLETVGILGHGLQTIYPAKHSDIANKMMNKGGLLTEFSMQSTIERENFVQRNRIVAGISQATIVIESACKGGSMSSACFANDYNRDVFAVPGRIEDVMSKGCNELIRNNRAQLLSDPLELIEVLNWNKVKLKQKIIQPKLFLNLSQEEQIVYEYLQENDREMMDLIAFHCCIPIYKVSTILLQLELQGLIRPLPGKYFEYIP